MKKPAPAKPPAYKAKFIRTSDGWVGEIAEPKSIHEQARTLETLEEKLDQAIKESGAPAGTTFTIQYPPEVLRILHPHDRAAHALAAAELAQHEATIVAVRLFKEYGLSLRDTAKLLGYSHQRIQQLLGVKDF